MDPKHVTNTLAWWHEKRFVYPRLHRMALDYLTIPGEFDVFGSLVFILTSDFLLATSVDVEHVFSQGRLLLSHIRSCLSVQSTRALMCLGVWSILGYVKDSDVKAVIVLPELQADEQEEELEIGWDRVL